MWILVASHLLAWAYIVYAAAKIGKRKIPEHKLLGIPENKLFTGTDTRTALPRDQQRRWQWWVGPGGAAIGFALFPLLAAFAPGGSHLAALATGNADRWQAGAYLSQQGDPAGSRALAAALNLVKANTEALQQACSEAARKAGKEQKGSAL